MHMLDHFSRFHKLALGSLVTLATFSGISITQAASSDLKPIVSKHVTSSGIAGLFQSVYGRSPLDSEKRYWIGRIKDKPMLDALRGAMAFQKTRGKSPHVLGTTSYNLLAQQDFQGQDTTGPASIRARVTVLPDGKIKPGDNVRFVIRVYNDGSSTASAINMSFIPDPRVAEFVAAKPPVDFSTAYIESYAQWQNSAWLNVAIPPRSSRDFSITYRIHPAQALNSGLKFTAWLGQGDYQIDRSFVVPIASSRGDQRAVNTNPVDNYFRVATGRFPTSAERTHWTVQYEKFLTNTTLGGSRDDRVALFIKAVAKKVGSNAASKEASAFQKEQGKNPTSTGKKSSPAPTPTPALKFTDKDFRILGPDSLNTDKGDQGITWHASAAVQRAYPKVKIELCPGKDFKGCIILDAVVENDGNHLINMPPVPRIGKWYLRLIGRNQSGGIVPSASIIRLITLHK